MAVAPSTVDVAFAGGAFVFLTGSILGIVVLCIINFLIAREFYRVACAKGFDSKKYLWIPFFFTVIGYLLVIALPNKTNGNVQGGQQ